MSQRTITAAQIRLLIEKKFFVYAMPDMQEVRCVFTDGQIGELPFVFVRRRNGENKRIVLCLG